MQPAPVAAPCPRTFIRCLGAPIHAALVERLRTDPAWRIHELATNHMAMLHQSQETTDLLLQVATAVPA